MKIDRNIQREILERLAAVYPNGLYPLAEKVGPEFSLEEVVAITQYLHEHGLVKSGYVDRQLINRPLPERWAEPRETFITAKGIDFLADDGGIGAILGVVTVKLDASSIKALVISRIDQAEEITHGEQSRLKTLVHTAGGQSLRKLVDTLIEAGLKAAPNAHQLAGMLQGLLA